MVVVMISNACTLLKSKDYFNNGMVTGVALSVCTYSFCNFLLTVIPYMAIRWHSMYNSWSHAKVLQ